MWRKGSNISWDKEGHLRSKPFIRLEGNRHVLPFDESGKPQAYLPGNSSSSFPTVKKSIAEDDEAREFLEEEIGLTEPDNVAEVIEFVLPQYEQIYNDHQPSEEDNYEHVKKILQAMETDSENKRKDLIERLKGTPFLLSYNPATEKHWYKKPAEIYFSEAYIENVDLETYFEGYSEAFFLSLNYKGLDSKERMYQLFSSVGVESKPRRTKFEPLLSWEEKRTLWGESGCTYDMEYIDYDIEGLEHFLKNNTEVRKPVILWNYLLKHLEELERWSLESFFKGEYRWFYRSEKSAHFDAKFLKTLRQNSWLPDKQGNFHRPSAISFSELSDVFEKESFEAKKLAEKLGLKKDLEQQFIDSLPPEEKKRYELAKKIPLEDLEKLAEKYSTKFPEQPVSDKERRKSKARETYRSSQKKEFEKRERLVRISQDQIDKRTSLREWYQDQEGEGKVICQMCKTPSSFKNRHGKYYFEAVELINDEKEYDANAIALCPSCAAKYLYGDKTEDEEIRQGLRALFWKRENGEIDSQHLNISIELCGEAAQIQFVEKHLVDLSPLFANSDEDE